MEDLNVLYEDRDILVAVKPSGVESEAAKGIEPDMINLIRNRLQKEKGGSEKAGPAGSEAPYVGLIHRLDKPVEGIMVFAKTKEAAAALSKQTAEGTMKKKYRAVLCGQPAVPKGVFTDYLRKDPGNNFSEIVKKDVPGAKKAELRYAVLAKKYLSGEQISEVEIELVTGRHHQIRVQFAAHGLPLLGDRKYNPAYLKTGGKGNILPPAGLCAQPCGERLALCAVSLSFVHPKTRKPMSFAWKPSGPAWDLF